MKLTYEQTYGIISLFAQSNKAFILERVKLNNPSLLAESALILNLYIKFIDTKNFPATGGGGYVDVKAWKKAYLHYNKQGK